MQELVMPKLTAGVEEDIAGWGRKAISNIRWKVEAKASEYEKKLAKVGREFLNPNKTIVTNINNTSKALDKETKNLIDITRKSKYTFAPTEVSTRIDNLKLPISMVGEDALIKKYGAAKNALMEIVDKHPKTAEWLLTARKEFDALIRETYPNLYTNQAETPLRIAIKAVRDVPNQMISEGVGGKVVRDSLSTQKKMIDIIDNLATKSEKTGTTAIWRRAAKNPWKVRAATIAGSTLAGAGWLLWLQKILGWWSTPQWE